MIPKKLQEWIEEVRDTSGYMASYGAQMMAKEILTNPMAYGLVPIAEVEKLAVVVEVYVRAKTNNLIVPRGAAIKALADWQAFKEKSK